MRLRPILEILVVLGVVGVLLELADAHPVGVITAGVVAAIWLLARSH